MNTFCAKKLKETIGNGVSLFPIMNERFQYRTANSEDGARLDVKAGGIWRRGQTAFFDARITHVNTPSNQVRGSRTPFRVGDEQMGDDMRLNNIDCDLM